MKPFLLLVVAVLAVAGAARAQELELKLDQQQWKFKKSQQAAQAQQDAKQSDGDSADPSQAPAAGGAAFADCASRDKLLPMANDMRRYASKPVALFVESGADPSSESSSALCLYGSRVIFVFGLVPASTVRVSGDELVFESVRLAPDDRGRVALTAGEAASARLERDAVKTASGERLISMREEHHVPLAGLAERIGKISVVGKVESYSQVKDPDHESVAKTLTVPIYPGADARTQVKEALLRGADNTLCAKSGRVAPELDAYLSKVTASPALAKALGEFRPDTINANPPSVEFKCFGPGVHAQGVWNVAVPSWGDGQDILVARDGKISAR